MKNSTSITAGTAAVLMGTALLAGCNQPTASSPASSTADAPTEISIMSSFYSVDAPLEDNVITKEMEKRTNTKLKITWVSPNNYTEKSNVTLASGSIPDLMLILDPSAANVQQMAAQGAFWDITPYIKQYPNLAKYPEAAWNNTRINGKNYGLPRVRSTDSGGFLPVVRKDWLDKLNMKVPETMDEIYSVMKAFADNDLDGNGKKDTVGLGGHVDAEGMGYLNWLQNVFNSSNGRWKLVDDNLVNTELEPGTRQMLEWLRKAFSEGLISPDFPVMKLTQSDDLMRSGKTGLMGFALSGTWILGEELFKKDPKADILPLTYIKDASGRKLYFQESGYFGMFLIPKTVPEAKLKKILAFMDYGASDEGSDLANYGLKDIHYTEKDGFKLGTEQAKKDNVAQQVWGQIFLKYDPYLKAYAAGIPLDKYERNKKITDARKEFAVPLVSSGLVSDTATKVGKEYDKKIQDMKVKVIMGKEPLEAWDSLVSSLKQDAQYQKITSEMNEAYKKRQGK